MPQEIGEWAGSLETSEEWCEKQKNGPCIMQGPRTNAHRSVSERHFLRSLVPATGEGSREAVGLRFLQGEDQGAYVAIFDQVGESTHFKTQSDGPDGRGQA